MEAQKANGNGSGENHTNRELINQDRQATGSFNHRNDPASVFLSKYFLACIENYSTRTSKFQAAVSICQFL